MTQREKIWEIVSKKKTKSDFFEVSKIVSEIETMLANERRQGVLDAIESLQVQSQFDDAITLIRKENL